jgi:hypothetical protein
MRRADEEFVQQIPNGQDMVAEFLNPSHVGHDIDVILTIKVLRTAPFLVPCFRRVVDCLAITGWSRKSRLANLAATQ